LAALSTVDSLPACCLAAPSADDSIPLDCLAALLADDLLPADCSAAALADDSPLADCLVAPPPDGSLPAGCLAAQAGRGERHCSPDARPAHWPLADELQHDWLEGYKALLRLWPVRRLDREMRRAWE
jgi:hypothetical protein